MGAKAILGAKALATNDFAFATKFASKNIRYAYRRLAECHDKVQLSKAISAPHIDSYYTLISFKNLHAYVLIDS